MERYRNDYIMYGGKQELVYVPIFLGFVLHLKPLQIIQDIFPFKNI